MSHTAAPARPSESTRETTAGDWRDRSGVLSMVGPEGDAPPPPVGTIAKDLVVPPTPEAEPPLPGVRCPEAGWAGWAALDRSLA